MDEKMTIDMLEKIEKINDTRIIGRSLPALLQQVPNQTGIHSDLAKAHNNLKDDLNEIKQLIVDFKLLWRWDEYAHCSTCECEPRETSDNTD
jgi:hypothetical protein